MLSLEDLETLIASKRCEIEREKAMLGLRLPPNNSTEEENKENVTLKNQVSSKEKNGQPADLKKPVIFEERRILCDRQHNEMSTDAEQSDDAARYKVEEKIPPDLERYIRRYIGIPAMLKAGEYSPNNPLVRAFGGGGGGGGGALRGLGEYERRRDALRRHRQAQYRDYLDQQAKKKQEAKEQAERERCEREERERQREERQRQLLLEREKYSPERRRASVTSVPVNNAFVQTTKVDTGVQADGLSSPLSVAVQTDDIELYQLSPCPLKCLTEAERELSPRSAADAGAWGRGGDGARGGHGGDGRRRSQGDYDERTCTIKKTNREKLVSDLRHSYMPSIFDADAIHMRNLQAEKEAAARRQFYQQELKNQILEQQRIREERKSREKMLEQAEMRRLEEQLRMLRVAQEGEIDKQRDISAAMKDSAKDYNAKRAELQKEIDFEQQKLLRSTSQHTRNLPKRFTNTSQSDTPRSKLPFFYPSEKTYQATDKNKNPYSFNIPDNSVFSANYDVDSYLRKNLNFRDKMDLNIENIRNNKSVERNKDVERNRDVERIIEGKRNNNFERNGDIEKNKNVERTVIVEKALIHEHKEKPQENIQNQDLDNLSIPLLRHSPKIQQVTKESITNLSDAMKKVDDKWKVPAVQKNILKSLPNEEGKNISILTQLGSIRRQLQLEQLKLDKMLSKDEA